MCPVRAEYYAVLISLDYRLKRAAKAYQNTSHILLLHLSDVVAGALLLSEVSHVTRRASEMYSYLCTASVPVYLCWTLIVSQSFDAYEAQ